MKNCYKHFEKQTWKNNSKLSEKEDSRIKKKKKKTKLRFSVFLGNKGSNKGKL